MATECSVDLVAANTLMANQASLIRDKIQEGFAKESVYLNVVDGDTVDLANQGPDIKTLTTARVSLADSRVRPTFNTVGSASCDECPEADEFGFKEFTTQLETKTGRSPEICVDQAYSLVKNQLRAAAEAMKQANKETIDNDVRVQLLDRSGVKYVANSAQSFNSRITGGRDQVSVDFNGTLPDSPMSLQEINAIVDGINTYEGTTLFGSGAAAHALLVVGPEQLRILRYEAETRNLTLSLAQGGYDEGRDAIQRLRWLDFQTYGFKANVDKEPLRFNELDEDGNPVLIEPCSEVSTDYGKDAAYSSAWKNAAYEIGFIIFNGSFKRVVPKTWTGEGEWKFAPQMTMGELKWHNVQGQYQNMWGKNGFFIYRMTRAYQAIQPHGIVPIAYKRCATPNFLTSCEGVS